MKKHEVSFRIICQTLAALGLGLNLCGIGVLKLPGGEQMIARLFNSETVPYLQLAIMTTLCLMGTIMWTVGNIESMKMKKKKKNKLVKANG